MNIERYRKRAKHNVSESTLNSRLSAMRQFEKFIGRDKEPTVEDVEDWIDHMIDEHDSGNIKASTMREYYKSVKYYFQVVKGEEDSLSHISKWIPSNDSDAGDFLDRQEWQDIQNCLYNIRDATIFKLMYLYARRPTEVTLLNMRDIDFEEGTITFNILKKKDNDLPTLKLGKTDEGRWKTKHRVMRATFEMKPEAESALKDYLPYRTEKEQECAIEDKEFTAEPVFTTSHGRVSYDTVWRSIKEAVGRTDIDKNITPKGMRHSRATHLDWDGKEPGNIARDVLIHGADTNVISRYVHDRDEEQVRELMSLDDED